MSEFERSLSGFIGIAQWFVWRMTWDATLGKYKKIPARADGLPYAMDSSKPENWHSYADAVALRNHLSADGGTYALGFYLTAACGYWFLDIDGCADDAGNISALAQEMLGRFPGAAGEWSSSSRGLHIFGKGSPGPHATKPPKRLYPDSEPPVLEFYTDKRPIAFGLTGEAWGSMDTVHDGAVAALIAQYFPPSNSAPLAGDYLPASGPRPGWNGPTDDDELIRRALASRSAGAAFGNKASFADLWHCDVEKLTAIYGSEGRSSWDMALANMLAFWTGCDEERMERLMRRSALMRDKWDEHRTYLRELTIRVACDGRLDVYSETRKSDAALYTSTSEGPAESGEMITAEQSALCEKLLDEVGASESVADVHNRVIPMIRAAGLVGALMPRLEVAVNKRLELWDSKLPVGQLRQLLAPKAGAVASIEAPPFVHMYVYSLRSDMFVHLPTGGMLSFKGFGAKHDRQMPMRETGSRESAAQWALEHWELPTVDDVMYRPGHPAVFEWEGLQWANTYRLPPSAAAGYTERGAAAIDNFLRLMWAMTDGRLDVYTHLLSFMAHNVQYPGVKIRHCPLIKGIEGDGKSIIGNVLRACMGWSNVKPVGPSIVANSSGFTDWAHGAALAVFEEINITGRDRYRVSNLIKEYISNNVVSINGKGDKPKTVLNTMNQLALTNYGDAVPIGDNERRWMIVYTPYRTLDDLGGALGEKDLGAFFSSIFDALEDVPGEFRKYFIEFQIPDSFKPNAPAPMTPEKGRMQASGMEDVEAAARHIVDAGGYGIGSAVLSSSALTGALRVAAMMGDFEVPKTTTLAHLLNRMGFTQSPRPIKWDGKTHRVWTLSGISDDPDELREALDATKGAGAKIGAGKSAAEAFGKG